MTFTADTASTAFAADSADTAFTTSWSHTYGLRGDGTAQCWGRNEYGQTNVPDRVTLSFPPLG